MPDAARLLHTLTQAAEAFRATPGRSGRLVRLIEAREVFVTGDLHGHVENFRRILRRADLARYPARHLVVQELIHGPFRYPDGGDKSHQLVDLVAALKCQFPRQVHLLLGNHELAQWTGRIIYKGDDSKNGLFRRGVETAYGSQIDDIYTAYLKLFAVAPVALRTTNRVWLSHSLPSANQLPRFEPAALERDDCLDGELLLGGSIHSLLWGRDTSASTVTTFLRQVDADLAITGHISCEGHATPNDRQLILESDGAPACYCLFPTDRPLTQADLLVGIGVL